MQINKKNCCSGIDTLHILVCGIVSHVGVAHLDKFAVTALDLRQGQLVTSIQAENGKRCLQIRVGHEPARNF